MLLYSKQLLKHIMNRSNSLSTVRLRAKKGPAPPPPLGNFADISYLKENFKPHLLRDVCTLCSGALVSLNHLIIQISYVDCKLDA